MDISPVGSSVTISPPRLTLFVTRVLNIVVIGVLLGVVATEGLFFIPYDRVVVGDQAVSYDIYVTSVHITHGGYVVVYLKEDNGWVVVGHTWYLPRGYYRNMVIPIDPLDKAVYGNSHFLVRLYRDRDDKYFDEARDIPVKDLFGRIYQKHFWFTNSQSLLKQTIAKFVDDPMTTLGDLLFP